MEHILSSSQPPHVYFSFAKRSLREPVRPVAQGEPRPPGWINVHVGESELSWRLGPLPDTPLAYRRHLDRLRRPDRALFGTTPSQHQILDAIDVIQLGRMNMAVEHNDLEILRIGRNDLMRIVGGGDWSEPRPGKNRVVKGDEVLRTPAALASSSHACNCVICSAYFGRSASQSEGNWTHFPLHRKKAARLRSPIRKRAAPGSLELFQIGDGGEHSVDLGITPNLMVADPNEPAAFQPCREHLVIEAISGGAFVHWTGAFCASALVLATAALGPMGSGGRDRERGQTLSC